MKYLVYTAITGGKNNLIDPKYKDPEVEYICFTDNKNIKSNIWNIELVDEDLIHKFTNNDGGVDYTRVAKKYKILPHTIPILSNFDMTLWIDGSIYLKIKNVKKFMNSVLAYSKLVVFKSVRKSVEQEIEYCIRKQKDNPKILIEQYTHYKCLGFPDDLTLVNGSFILRCNKDTSVINFNENWWDEIINYSKRDEVSFPYVAWKTKFKYGLLPWEDRNECPFIEVIPHRR